LRATVTQLALFDNIVKMYHAINLCTVKCVEFDIDVSFNIEMAWYDFCDFSMTLTKRTTGNLRTIVLIYHQLASVRFDGGEGQMFVAKVWMPRS
jgi:hypothetical protein